MSSTAIGHCLDSALRKLPPGPILVGYSGGMDSHVLLHALASSHDARARGLRAGHVDHGLHPESAAWLEHCRSVASALDVAMGSATVQIQTANGSGVEDAARTARMAAFSQMLRPGEILALAHQRDDQAETVLLKLLRGAGPEGLGAMRTLRKLDQALLWRPLLGLPRRALRDYAQMHALRWIDDPSNTDDGLRRNFLRTRILPALKTRWPEAEAALAHSATWAQAAADFIAQEAHNALARVQGVDPGTLVWRDWIDLPDALRDPVLRLWLRERSLGEPSHLHVAELERQLLGAGKDRLPCVRFGNTELRRYRDLLYAIAAFPRAHAGWELAWSGASVALPAGGRLELTPTRQLGQTLHLRYRRGGERIKLAGGQHHRSLRLLLQESGTPPWQRERLPLIYRDTELIAVADLFLSDAGEALCRELDAAFVWSPDSR